MVRTNWKIIAIIFIVLFTLETAFLIWAVALYQKEINRTYECYFDICGEFADADYIDKVCTCYDYDSLGDLIVTKQKYLK